MSIFSNRSLPVEKSKKKNKQRVDKLCLTNKKKFVGKKSVCLTLRKVKIIISIGIFPAFLFSFNRTEFSYLMGGKMVN
jgi:hypothetical protein